MNIDWQPYTGTEALSQSGRRVGVALVLAGVFLALLLANDSSFSGGWFWSFVYFLLLGPVTAGGIVLALSPRLRDEDAAWLPWFARALLLALLALTVESAGKPLIISGGESGFWGVLRASSSGAALVILLFVVIRDDRRTALIAIAAAVALVAIAFALGLHESAALHFNKSWSFLGSVIRPAGLAAVLLLASLRVLGASRQPLQRAALVAALAVLVAGLAYSIWLADFAVRDSGLLFVSSMAGHASLALLILVAGRAVAGARVLLSAAAVIFLLSAASSLWLLGQNGADGAEAAIWVLISQVGDAALVVFWWLVLARESEPAVAVQAA